MLLSDILCDHLPLYIVHFIWMIVLRCSKCMPKTLIFPLMLKLKIAILSSLSDAVTVPKRTPRQRTNTSTELWWHSNGLFFGLWQKTRVWWILDPLYSSNCEEKSNGYKGGIAKHWWEEEIRLLERLLLIQVTQNMTEDCGNHPAEHYIYAKSLITLKSPNPNHSHTSCKPTT